MKSIKNAMVNMLLMSAVLLVTLLIAESVVRFLYKDAIVMYPRYQTAAHYDDFSIRKLRPSSVFWHTSVDGHWKFKTNAQGFRNDRDFSYDKPKGSIRVLSLGDSHTEGFEVRQDHTFSAVIEQQLLAAGLKAEVINTGVSGFSNAEELVLLEHEGLKYHPDYVVLGFFSNDFADNVNAGIYGLDSHDQLLLQKKDYIPGVKIQDFIYSVPGVQWLSENSYFYSILFNGAWTFFKSLMAKNSFELAIPSTDSSPKIYEQELAFKLLKRIHKVCSIHGIKLILLDIPLPEQYGKLKNGQINPSMPEHWNGKLDYIADVVIPAGILSDHGANLTHVPHGHQHISEYSHRQFGLAVAKFIKADL